MTINIYPRVISLHTDYNRRFGLEHVACMRRYLIQTAEERPLVSRYIKRKYNIHLI